MALQLVADNPELDPDMTKALGLMLAGPINYSRIADQCGITTQTLWRWRQTPAFKAALTSVKRSILGDTAIKLVLEVENSIDALVRLRDDVECPANVQMASAKTIVDWAFKHVELAEQANDTAEMESRILDDENQKG
jgi:transposase-like protein